MYEDGMGPQGKGLRAYHAYLMRALFHSFVSDAVDTMMGMLWCKPPTFEIPSQLDYLREKATTEGEGLFQLLRAINRQQLITGRLGLMTDLSKDTGTNAPRPYIATYHAEKIINWDAGFPNDSTMETTKMVVLDESGPRRIDTFQWEDIEQYRVLMLGDAMGSGSSYRFGVFSAATGEHTAFDQSAMKVGGSRGTEFDHIPWVFINANSTVSTPCDPPLIGLSDLCLAIYRLEADYRQALFMQTQDTLFTKGFPEDKDKPLRVGAGGRIHAPSGQNADAKYIGVTSKGLPELREARDNDLKMAASKAGELMDASSRARESGTALEMRIGSKTATMNEIAISGAEGLQRALKDCAQWMGIRNTDSIVVKPNFEFSSKEYGAQDFRTIVESKLLGAPISWQAIHKWSAERGGPGKDLSFEELMAQIEEEGLLDDMLSEKITPKEQADLDLKEQEIQAQEEAAQQPAQPPARPAS
jgi:hypothetical protein